MEGVALRMPIRLGSPKSLGHDHACPPKFRMFVWFVALKSHWFRICENLPIKIFGWAESHCGLWQIETFGWNGGTLGCCDDRPLFPAGNACHLVGPAQIRNLA